MSTVFKVQVILTCHLPLTLCSSVFPKLLIISVYVTNFNRFIFCELVLFSLQALIRGSSCKRIVLRKEMSGMRVLPLDLTRRFCHFSHMLALLPCYYLRHCIEIGGHWYLSVSHIKRKTDNCLSANLWK